MRDQLLPLAVSEADFERVAPRAPGAAADRRCRRRRSSSSTGSPTATQQRLKALLARHVGAPLDVAAIEKDLAIDRRAWTATRP